MFEPNHREKRIIRAELKFLEMCIPYTLWGLYKVLGGMDTLQDLCWLLLASVWKTASQILSVHAHESFTHTLTHWYTTGHKEALPDQQFCWHSLIMYHNLKPVGCYSHITPILNTASIRPSPSEVTDATMRDNKGSKTCPYTLKKHHRKKAYSTVLEVWYIASPLPMEMSCPQCM